MGGEVNLYRGEHAARDFLLTRLRSEEIGVVLVRDKAGFEQHRRRVGRLQSDKGREAVGVGAEMHLVCRLTLEQAREIRRDVHSLALREVEKDRDRKSVV